MTFPSDTETIQRFKGGEDVLRAMVGFLKNAKSVSMCGDSAAVTRAMEIESVKRRYETLKRRKVNVRWITEITKENLIIAKP